MGSGRGLGSVFSAAMPSLTSASGQTTGAPLKAAAGSREERRRVLKLGARLGAGLASICVVLLGLAGIVAWQLLEVHSGLRATVDEANRRAALAADMLQQQSEIAVSVRNMALLLTNQDLDGERSVLATTIERYTASESQLRVLVSGPGEAERLIGQIRESREAALPLVLQAAQLGMDGAAPEATMLISGKVRPAMAEWHNHVQRLIQLESLHRDSAYQVAQAHQRRVLVGLSVCALAAVAVAVGLGFSLTRSVTRPITEAMRVAERVSSGDLTSAICIERHDELGRLLHALGAMQERLSTMVSEIRDATESIHGTASDIAEGHRTLTHRAEQATVRLQQTALSMDGIMRRMRQSDDAAQLVSEMAVSASSVAARGGQEVARVVSTMDGISQASKKIVDIIAVIDGIAFQTNILALNASVEAARAGNSGRGFAVVADEVRSLARRTAAAAQEIEVLIRESGGQVEAGATLVRNTGSTMVKIVDSAHCVADTVGTISEAVAAQRSGIAQVNETITQLEDTTRQNAVLVQRSAASGQNLRAQADRLHELVRAFRTSD